TVKKNGSKEFWELNLETLEYGEPTKPRFKSIGKARKLDSLAERLKVVLSADDRAGELVRALTFHGLAYASHVIPEIADTPKPIDDAMRWGFRHEAGPFEIWDMLGVAETANRMREAGFVPAAWVDEMLEKGHANFYRGEGDGRGVYHPGQGRYAPLKADPSIIILKNEKEAGKIIAENPGATMIDLGDGVACVEFHTKMNTFDVDMMTMIGESLDRVQTDFDGLVIGNNADNFSAGANLFLLVMNAQAGQWDVLESMIKQGQDLFMKIRYFDKPVVAAPAGLALAGAAEVVMSSNRVELYIGLVEVGVGVIPAWGGTKEMVRRNINPVMRTKNADVLPHLQTAFELVGQAKVATSAEEARQFGIPGPCDRVVMNRDHLLAEAKREVLAMAAAGYIPPRPEKVYAAGRDALSALRVAIYMFREGGYITGYDTVVGEKLAYVMTGGELSKPQWVTEQYILDLEREAFLSLCGEERTQQRIWHTLNTGKPLRN
ncbi:MAG: enoyl-CoA hydratase-related protein, partial [Anaerolineales bacterium]